MATVTSPPQSLATVTDEEFRKYVDSDIRRAQPGRSPDEIAALERIHQELRSPAVIERWYTSLLLMKKSVEAQLGAKKAELAAKRNQASYSDLQVEFNRWKAGTLRFLNAVEEKLLEARSLRYRLYLPRLQDAIAEHRQAVLGDDEDFVPEPADERLWSVLKELPK